jgi:hypothetical protein
VSPSSLSECAESKPGGTHGTYASYCRSRRYTLRRLALKSPTLRTLLFKAENHEGMSPAEEVDF